ncbi:MAG: sulfite exporter TauE/SafE family protein [Candidatus Dormibacteria bacterium]
MSALQALAIAGSGLAAGAFNTIAGGGSLLTFPLLVALGLPPLDANVTNTVGIVPAAVGGMAGFRRELASQRRRLALLLPVTAAGAVAGAVILLHTPARAFDRVVPLLIVAACVVLLLQGVVRQAIDSLGAGRRGPLLLGMGVSAVYGGYFGAAVSVIILAILVVTVDDTLPQLNALKVPLAGSMNLVSGLVFAVFGPVHWGVVAVLAPATLVGGRLGAGLARRLPAGPLRLFIVAFGMAGATWLAFAR